MNKEEKPKMNKKRIVVLAVVLGIVAVMLFVYFFAEHGTDAKVSVYLQDAESGRFVLSGQTKTSVSNKNPVYSPSDRRGYKIDGRSVLKAEISNGCKEIEFVVYYACETCVVTFDGDGGRIVSGEERQVLRLGQKFKVPVYEKEGYVLKGFKRAGVESDLPVTDSAVYEDTDFVAIWEAV